MSRANRRPLLVAFVDRQERVPFGYGSNDCLLMTASAIAAVTGHDPAADYRGKYLTLEEGKALVGGSLIDFVAGQLPEIHLSEAGDGDIGAFLVGEEWSFGVVIDAALYVQAEGGLGVLPRRRMQRAFRVD